MSGPERGKAQKPNDDDEERSAFLRQKIVRTRRINEPLSVSSSRPIILLPVRSNGRSCLGAKCQIDRISLQRSFLWAWDLLTSLGLGPHPHPLLLPTMMYEPVTHPTTATLTGGPGDSLLRRIITHNVVIITTSLVHLLRCRSLAHIKSPRLINLNIYNDDEEEKVGCQRGGIVFNLCQTWLGQH